MVTQCRTTSLALSKFTKIHSFTEIIQNRSLNTYKLFYWRPDVTTASYHSFSLHIYFESLRILDVDSTLSRCNWTRTAHRRVGAALFKGKHPNIVRAPSYMSFRLFLTIVKNTPHFNSGFGGKHADYKYNAHTMSTGLIELNHVTFVELNSPKHI